MLSGVLGATFFALSTAPLSAQPASPLVAKPNASLPAVDGFNSTIEPFGGVMQDHGIYGLAGTYTLPLGHSYGFQIDGVASQYRDRFLGGIGAHLFWRDPSVGLLGLYGAHTYYDRLGGITVNHVAVEFERYNGRWSLQGIAGVEFGDGGTQNLGGGVTFVYDVPTRFFDKINLNYYVNDNTMLTVGHRYVGGRHALALAGEWAVPLASNRMAALVLEGRYGENDYRAFWAGLRFYQGRAEKTLIRRHREDDPINWIPETLFGLLNNAGNASICGPGEVFDGLACFPIDE